METLLKFFRGQAAPSRPPDSLRDEVFLFVHMPKTGGQTLRNFFERHLVFHKEFIHLGPYGLQKAQELGLLPFERRPLEERALARVILGHNVNIETHKLVPGKIPRHILFLRGPAEALVSYYNFQMRQTQAEGQHTVPFEAWYDSTKKGNMMTRWLLTEYMRERHEGAMTARTLKKVMQELHRFWFVGCTEYLDRDAPVLLKRMGLGGPIERTNVSGVHHPKILELDANLKAMLHRENQLDVELYEYWRSRLEQNLSRIRAESRQTEEYHRCG